MGSSTRVLTKPARPALSGSPCKACYILIVKFSETYFLGSGKGNSDHHCQASWTDYPDLCGVLEKDAVILPYSEKNSGPWAFGSMHLCSPVILAPLAQIWPVFVSSNCLLSTRLGARGRVSSPFMTLGVSRFVDDFTILQGMSKGSNRA